MASQPPVSENYTITAEIPTAEEYAYIRAASGLSAPPKSAIPAALSNTLHCILARDRSTGNVIGLSRLVGDGALFAELVDVAVHPDHQRKGLGRAMLAQMVLWIDAHCPEAYVSLIGAPLATRLYREFGWVDTKGIGMKRSVWGR